MEKQFESKDVPEDQLNERAKKNVLKTSLKIGATMVFLVFLSITAIYLFTRVDEKPRQMKPTGIATVSPQLSKTSQIRNKFETDKTQIATSLEVPPMYAATEWRDVIEKSSNEGLNEAWVYEEGIQIPFKGRYWASNSSVEFFSVQTYYWDKLSKLGWVTPGGEKNSLEFNSFSLSGIDADAACVGAIGSLGYKDGFVRLLTIKYTQEPCSFLDFPDTSPYPSDIQVSTYYTIFISDPMPIEEVVKYVRPSPTAGS